jgi:YCII-related domain
MRRSTRLSTGPVAPHLAAPLPAASVAGPFLDPSGQAALAGLFVLQAGSLAEAQQLVATDPAVHAGRFVAEILPWLGPKSLQALGSSPAK